MKNDRNQGIRQNSTCQSWWSESSPMSTRRQLLNCSSLSFLLISLISSMNIFISSPSLPILALTCQRGMAHWKLGAKRWACPHLLFPAGWWPFPLYKGWSSSPLCMRCSISSFSRCIFVIFFFLVVFLGLSLLIAPLPDSHHKCTATTLGPADLLLFPRPVASLHCAGQWGAGTQKTELLSLEMGKLSGCKCHKWPSKIELEEDWMNTHR